MLMRKPVAWLLLVWGGLGLAAVTGGWPFARRIPTAPCARRLSALQASGASPHPVFGHELAAFAVKLLAVNPAIGSLGLVGSGETAKSLLAHSLWGGLPPWIESHDATTSPPFIVVPANVGEDRLFGSIDVKRTLEGGAIVKSAGLMAGAHGGVLLANNLLAMDNVLVAKLFQALGEGIARVEAEGLSFAYPCQSLLVATMQPGDDAPRAIIEHLSMIVDADCGNWTLSDRAKAVGRAIQPPAALSPELSPASQSSGDRLRFQFEVMEARRRLKSIQLTLEQVEHLVHTAHRIGCVGLRPEISAARVAIASAALAGSTVRPEDIAMAEELALFPKSMSSSLLSSTQSPSQGKPAGSASSRFPQHDPSRSHGSAAQTGPSVESRGATAPKDKSTKLERSEHESVRQKLSSSTTAGFGGDEAATMMNFAASSSLLPSILPTLQSRRTEKVSTQAHRAGKGGQALSYDRGRFVRAVHPAQGKPLRIAIFATLLEAAKRHALRANESKNASSPIRIEPQDLRVKVMTRSSAALRIIVMDTSGSMAANRMAKAKGAAALLVAEAYRSRDKVALISCSGRHAQVVLHPTKSLASAKRAIDDLPCGGGSPLVHGLHEAIRIGCAALAKGSVARCIVALISDGQPNIPLAVSLNMPQSSSANRGGQNDTAEARRKLEQELLGLAKQIGSHPAFQLLVIDSESSRYGKEQFFPLLNFIGESHNGIGMAQEIAQVGGGKYLRIPFLSAPESVQGRLT